MKRIHVTNSFIIDCARGTVMGVELDYRSELLDETREWALANYDNFVGNSEFKDCKFADTIADKMQDIASSNHYPLVSDLFA